MADNTSDDVYNDPDNILADSDDSVDGATELPKAQQDEVSQSIFNPEKTASGDDRGAIDELDVSDGDESFTDEARHHPEDTDPDSNRLADVEPADEQDGTES